MESLTVMYNIPKDKQTLLFTHIRLAHGFSNHKKRLQAVQARLHAISILGELKRFLSNTMEVFTPGFNHWRIWFSAVYSNALQESANSILYNGLIEELVDVLQITDKQLVVSKYFHILAKKTCWLEPQHVNVTVASLLRMGSTLKCEKRCLVATWWWSTLTGSGTISVFSAVNLKMFSLHFLFYPAVCLFKDNRSMRWWLCEGSQTILHLGLCMKEEKMQVSFLRLNWIRSSSPS